MFDARAAKALSPGDHLTVATAPGLRLVATESGRRWVYRYKSPVDGRMRQQKLGMWPAMPISAALAAWERARTLRGTGVDPVVQRRADRAVAVDLAVRQGYSVRALCNDYLNAHADRVVHRTWAETNRMFRVELGPIERMPATALTRANAFDLLYAKRSRPMVAHRLRQALGSAWDHALDAGRLPPETPNWWRLVLRGKLQSMGKKIEGESVGVGKRVLDEAEVGELLRWLPNFPRDVADALTLYLWTCCRGGEIVAMERGEITREADGVWWTIPRDKLKMRRNVQTLDLRVPLVGRALAVVERRLQAAPAEWLFPSAGVSGHVGQKRIATAVWGRMPYGTEAPDTPRLPVTRWAPHDLRRTGRTMLSAMGCPAEVAEAILGHLLPGVQGVYDRHGYNAERRVWLTRLSERLEALGADR